MNGASAISTIGGKSIWVCEEDGDRIVRFLKTVGLVVFVLIAAPPLWFMAFPEPARTLPAPGTRVFVAPDTAVNVLDAGSGPAVVLVHGLPGTAYDWRELTPLLNAAGLRTIAYDRVGYGHSDARPSGPFTLSANVEDLLALLEAMDLNDVTLVGWSYGGAMALNVAHAPRVGRIVLIGSGGPSSDDDMPPAVPLSAKILYSTPVVWWRVAVPPVSRALQAALSDVAFSGGAQPNWWLKDLAAAFTRWDTVQTYQGEVLSEIEVGDFDATRIGTPTLIIHAEDDRLAPVAMGRYLAGRIPNAVYREVPGASHMLPVTHAPFVADEIVAFVN